MSHIVDKENWIINRAEEVSLQLTGYEFNNLCPHMQLMCYMRAEQDYTDYRSGLNDYIYEQEKYRRLEC